MMPTARSVLNYEKIGRIGEGTYGIVYRAREVSSGKIFALKKVRLEKEKEGFPITALREILVLQGLCHPNIVQLKEVVTTTDVNSVFLVFEHCDMDMGFVLDSILSPRKQKLTSGQVKNILKQVLQALVYLHDNWIVHRDVKMSNLLFNRTGQVKLADFGLARHYTSPLRPFTPRVVTLWYRAPELLLTSSSVRIKDSSSHSNIATYYSTPIDMWAVGCLFGELIIGKPILPGKDEIDQLLKIFELLGTPNDDIWQGSEELLQSLRVSVTAQPYSLLGVTFPELTNLGFDLLEGLLCYDPNKRYTADAAIHHPYFDEEPLEEPLEIDFP
eukprot:jgi/Galph1/4742/GphlegSOOS_G3346.1